MNSEFIRVAQVGICTRRGDINMCWSITFTKDLLIYGTKVLNVKKPYHEICS